MKSKASEYIISLIITLHSLTEELKGTSQRPYPCLCPAHTCRGRGARGAGPSACRAVLPALLGTGLLPFLLPASVVISRNLCLDLNPPEEGKGETGPQAHPKGRESGPHHGEERTRELQLRERTPGFWLGYKNFYSLARGAGPNSSRDLSA